MSSYNFGREYLLLGLRMGKLIEGFVDAYYGPSELKELVGNEKPPSPKNLLNSCRNLQKKLGDQGFIEERVKFLEKILSAIETSLKINLGEEIPYLEKVKRLYDIKPELINDSIFYKLAEKLDSIYQGSGTLIERYNAFKEKHDIPLERLDYTFSQAFKIVRENTYETFPDLFPDSEEISFEFVKDKPWGAYNWYLGDFKSRIDINTDIPVDCVNILKLVTHEAYPGHHTEHAIKEKQLYIEQERFEHSILLILTPETVISEGIGNTAADVLFSDKEKGQLILDHCCHNPSSEDLDVLIERYLGISKLPKLYNNLAIFAYEDEWSDDELVKYSLDFGFIPEENVRQILKFIRHPLWSTYIFNYSIGEALVKEKFGEHPSSKDFKLLLTHPILPSDLTKFK
ncbi:MAG: hypothetical protein HWN81_01470 [Candidatus Lokiarchaeota archaeon]|nr:hypothetical protein [Candidatus Lokiarchaeota archaeon]